VILASALGGCRKDPPAPPPVVVAPTLADRDYFEIWVNSKRGFMDRTGTVVIAPMFDEVHAFSEGLAAAHSGGLWGYIDGTGAWVIPPTFPVAHPFSEGRAQVATELYGRSGYIDATGKVVIAPQFDCTEPFRNGAAKVGTKTVISSVKSKYADVGIHCHYHYIDINGNKVAEPPAVSAPALAAAPLKADAFTTYRDRNGAAVPRPQFAYAYPFERGLALFTVASGEKNPLAGYVDEHGTIVWPASK
jgi:hypothetical protein